MTNEKMLEYAVQAKTLIDHVEFVGAALLLQNLQTILKEDIRRDCQKAKGLAKRDKLAAKVFAEIPEKRPLMRGYHHTQDGRFAICSPYRAYVTGETFGYEEAVDQLPIDKMLPRRETYPITVDLGALQAEIRTQKAEARAWNATHRGNAKKKPIHDHIVLDAGKFHIGVNPEYLLEFCQFFGTNTVSACDPQSPIQYCDPDTGDWGLLLPVRLAPGE